LRKLIVASVTGTADMRMAQITLSRLSCGPKRFRNTKPRKVKTAPSSRQMAMSAV